VKIVKTHELTPASMALMGASELLHIYNGLDCCVTAEVFHEIEGQLDNQTRATYEFSKALQAPILEMKLRGILVDQSQRLKTIAAYEKDRNILKANLERIFTEGIGRSFNWNSPAQMKELFYGILGLPPIKKRNSKGQYTPTVDRNALEALDSYFIAQPICSHLLGLRDIALIRADYLHRSAISELEQISKTLRNVFADHLLLTLDTSSLTSTWNKRKAVSSAR